MVIWLVVATYVVGALVATRIAWVRETNKYTNPSPTDAAGWGLVWPGIVVWAIVWGMFKALVWVAENTLFRPTKAQKADRAKRELEEARKTTLLALSDSAPELLSDDDRAEVQKLIADEIKRKKREKKELERSLGAYSDGYEYW